MVIRQAFPFAFEAPAARRLPPHMRMAIGASLALHLMAGGYLACFIAMLTVPANAVQKGK